MLSASSARSCGVLARGQADHDVQRTQTNEPGRALCCCRCWRPCRSRWRAGGRGVCGACLYPDRFSYRYGTRTRLDPPAGPGAALLTCAIEGPVPVPAAVPRVAWRAGIDLHPVDVGDSEETRWLETLIWPGQDARRRRLAAAIRVARSDPPYLVAGDLNDTIKSLAAQAPDGATLVIFHSAVLGYLNPPARAMFTAAVRELAWPLDLQRGTRRPRVRRRSAPAVTGPGPSLVLVLAQNGQPVAYTGPHGQYLHWCA